jgi:hypothetical protein
MKRISYIFLLMFLCGTPSSVLSMKRTWNTMNASDRTIQAIPVFENPYAQYMGIGDNAIIITPEVVKPIPLRINPLVQVQAVIIKNPQTDNTTLFNQSKKDFINRKFNCDTCKYGTNYAERMNAHRDRHQLIQNNPNIKNFVCNECFYLSIRESEFSSHCATHKVNKFKFFCPVEGCKTERITQKSIKLHMKQKHPQILVDAITLG